MVRLETIRDHSVVFEAAPKYRISDSFVDCEGYSVSSQGFLPTVADKVVKVTQSCPTLCDPMDYTVHGILQARLLEWVAFPFSRGSSQVSCIAGGFFYQLSHEGSLGSEMARTKNGQT